MERFVHFLKETKPSQILDVGTGSGNFIDLINSIYKEYTSIIGIDEIEAAIVSATKNFKSNSKVSFCKMDASSMTYENDSFDLVCLSNSLHHLGDIKGIFKEMERVLKPGGYLLLAEMISNNLTAKQKSHLLMHHFAAKLDRLEGHVHNDTYNDTTILELCKNNSDLEFVDNWILQYEGEKENSDVQIKWLLEAVDRLANKANDDDIFKEATEIKEYVKMNGFDSCPTMIVVIKK